jgi:hypothetical protein
MEIMKALLSPLALSRLCARIFQRCAPGSAWIAVTLTTMPFFPLAASAEPLPVGTGPVPVNAGPRAAGTLPLSAPTNLHAIQSLADCRNSAGGGLAGIGCAAAMQNHWYVLAWDWKGGAIDGFRVYERNKLVPTIRSEALHLAATIAQQSQVRVALLDPSQVGTSGCFSVTAYSGTSESLPSSQVCVKPANASSSVFVSVALSPSTQMEFYSYHKEHTNLNYCSSGSWPTFAEGTGVWRKMNVAAGTTDWGMVMSEAAWHAGTEPLACPEFFTQALRLGIVFTLPSDVATVQSAMLTGTVDQSSALCTVSVSPLATQLTPTNPASESSGYPPGGFASAFPSNNGWTANVWLDPGGSAITTLSGASPLSLDLTSMVKQSDGAGLLFESTADEIGSPSANSLHHADVATCQTTLRSIRLNVTYISKSAS